MTLELAVVSDAFGIVQVFQRDGDAVHGAAIVAAQDFGFCLPRLSHRAVVQHGDVAFEGIVEFVDAVEECAGKLNGRESARSLSMTLASPMVR